MESHNITVAPTDNCMPSSNVTEMVSPICRQIVECFGDLSATDDTVVASESGSSRRSSAASAINTSYNTSTGSSILSCDEEQIAKAEERRQDLRAKAEAYASLKSGDEASSDADSDFSNAKKMAMISKKLEQDWEADRLYNAGRFERLQKWDEQQMVKFRAKYKKELWLENKEKREFKTTKRSAAYMEALNRPHGVNAIGSSNRPEQPTSSQSGDASLLGSPSQQVVETERHEEKRETKQAKLTDYFAK